MQQQYLETRVHTVGVGRYTVGMSEKNKGADSELSRGSGVQQRLRATIAVRAFLVWVSFAAPVAVVTCGDPPLALLPALEC